MTFRVQPVSHNLKCLAIHFRNSHNLSLTMTEPQSIIHHAIRIEQKLFGAVQNALVNRLRRRRREDIGCTTQQKIDDFHCFAPALPQRKRPLVQKKRTENVIEISTEEASTACESMSVLTSPSFPDPVANEKSDISDPKHDENYPTLTQKQLLTEFIVNESTCDELVFIHLFIPESDLSPRIDERMNVLLMAVPESRFCRIEAASAPYLTNQFHLETDAPSVIALRNGKLVNRFGDFEGGGIDELVGWGMTIDLLRRFSPPPAPPQEVTPPSSPAPKPKPVRMVRPPSPPPLEYEKKKIPRGNIQKQNTRPKKQINEVTEIYYSEDANDTSDTMSILTGHSFATEDPIPSEEKDISDPKHDENYPTLTQKQLLTEFIVNESTCDELVFIHLFLPESDLSLQIDERMKVLLTALPASRFCRIEAASAPYLTNNFHLEKDAPSVIALRNGKLVNRFGAFEGGGVDELVGWGMTIHLLKQFIQCPAASN